jgi:hypothetical protein
MTITDIPATTQARVPPRIPPPSRPRCLAYPLNRLAPRHPQTTPLPLMRRGSVEGFFRTFDETERLTFALSLAIRYGSPLRLSRKESSGFNGCGHRSRRPTPKRSSPSFSVTNSSARPILSIARNWPRLCGSVAAYVHSPMPAAGCSVSHASSSPTPKMRTASASTLPDSTWTGRKSANRMPPAPALSRPA